MSKIKQGVLTVKYNNLIDQDHGIISFIREGINFEPVQFIMIDCVSQQVRQNISKQKYTSEPLLYRPFSIYSERDSSFNVLYKIKKWGKGTSKLSFLKEGDKVAYRGPIGRAVDVKEKYDKNSYIHLLAGGVGIAPITFLANKLIAAGYKVKIYFGLAETGNFLDFCLIDLNSRGIDSSDIWVSCEHINIETSISKYGSLLNDGGVRYMDVPIFQGNMIGAMNTCWFSQIEGTINPIFICAPKKVMQYIHNSMSHAKGKTVYTFMEEYLGCGVGVCCGCDINGHLLCKEGSIMDSKLVFERVSDE